MGREFSFDETIFTPGIRALLAHVAPRPGDRVLDAACGSGIPARLLGGTAGALASLDIGPNILKKARARYDGDAPAGWVRGDAQALPFADGAFDLALCHQGVQFCADPAAAVRELMRVTTVGGRVGVMTWAAIEHSPCYAALAEALGAELGEQAAAFVRRPFSLPAADDLRALWDRNGAGVEVARVEVPVELASASAFAAGFLRYLPPHLARDRDPRALADAVAARTAAALGGEGPSTLSMAAHVGRARRM